MGLTLNLQLKIHNSTCKIEGLPDQQFKELRELLSYSPDPAAAYFTGGYNHRRYLLDKRGEFPSGLLYIVKKYLRTIKLRSQLQDTRVVPQQKPGMFSFNPKNSIKPYLEQAASADLGAKHGQGTIVMPTGCGKSVAMAHLIHKLQVKTLVVVPNLSLKQQLSQTFKSLFGSLSNITIENIDSPALQKKGDYDCLIIDEAHHSAAKTYRQCNKKFWTNIYYRFFFTATPFRSRDEETLLYESVAGPVIYRVEYQTALQKGYIAPLEAYYYDLPKTEIKGDPFSWASMYSELVVNNAYRNKLIATLLDNLTASFISTLCLVKEIRHGENIKEFLLRDIAFAQGVNDNNRELLLEFNLNERKGLIGTNGVLGEGVDTKPAEFVVIAGLGKSKNQFMQQCGRGFRVSPGKHSCKIVLFNDKSHKWTKAHFKAQCKFLKEEYGIVPVKLPLPEIL